MKRAEEVFESIIDTFQLDPVTGVITNTKEVGATTPNGYRRIGHRSKGVSYKMLAHRLAFRLYNGRWPRGVVHHVNGDKQDNRPCNLTDISQYENNILSNRDDLENYLTIKKAVSDLIHSLDGLLRAIKLRIYKCTKKKMVKSKLKKGISA